MAVDLQGLYEKYVDYVQRLQEDFARHVGSNVSEAYRPHRMNFDDFCRTWQAWGQVEGVQEMWRRRFEAGYEVAAEELLRRLRAALVRRDPPAAEASLDKAA